MSDTVLIDTDDCDEDDYVVLLEALLARAFDALAGFEDADGELLDDIADAIEHSISYETVH